VDSSPIPPTEEPRDKGVFIFIGCMEPTHYSPGAQVMPYRVIDTEADLSAAKFNC